LYRQKHCYCFQERNGKHALKKKNHSEEANILAKAAMIIRNGIRVLILMATFPQNVTSIKSEITDFFIYTIERSRQTGVSSLSICWAVDHI